MTKNKAYITRFYREFMGNPRWKSYRVYYMETDLWIAVSTDGYNPAVEDYSMDRIIFYRSILNSHGKQFPEFLTSLTPLPATPDVHPIVRDMYKASEVAGTGPMSAVAGAIAEYICRDLIEQFGFPEVVVENGGDIFLKLTSPATITVYAGESQVSDKIGLIIKPDQTPLSVCCSSGIIGHSMSFGKADACMIACSTGALADAYATACCNEVKGKEMVPAVTEKMLQKTDVVSVIIIKDEKVGMGGTIEVTVL